MRRSITTFLKSLFCVAALAPAGALAQDAETGGSLALELNSVADTDAGSCRLIFVARNTTGTSVDLAAYQVAIFDAEGTVTRLTRFEFPGLADGRTKVFQFDLRDTACSSLGQFIINETVACTLADAGGDAEICDAGLAASSRTPVAFGL